MFERGELLLIPFPFTDLSSGKRRPVLALTRPDRYGDFVGMPVTSRSHHSDAVALTTADLVDGTLPIASWVRTDRVVTLNAVVVIKSLARVAARVVEDAVQQLCTRLRAG